MRKTPSGKAARFTRVYWRLISAVESYCLSTREVLVLIILLASIRNDAEAKPMLSMPSEAIASVLFGLPAGTAPSEGQKTAIRKAEAALCQKGIISHVERGHNGRCAVYRLEVELPTG